MEDYRKTKNLIYLCQKFPSPTRGDGKRILQHLEMFSEWFNITLVTFTEPEKELDLKLVKQFTGNILILRGSHKYKKAKDAIRRKDILATIKLLPDILWSILRGIPPEVDYYVNTSEIGQLKKKFSGEDVDLLFVNVSRVAEVGKEIRANLKILDYTDAISLNLNTECKVEKNLLWKVGYCLESILMNQYEHNVIKYYDKAVFISKRDAQYALGSNINSKVSIIPNYIKEISLLPKLGKDIIFLGRMDYPPNVDGVIWFSKKIMPVLREKCEDNIKFYIVGASPLEAVKKLHNGKDIIVTGYVKDIDKYFKKAAVSVAPIRFGAGIQNKVLESLARGIPIVATPIVAEPFPFDLPTAANPEEFVKLVCQLHKKYAGGPGDSSLAKLVWNYYKKEVVRKKWISILLKKSLRD